MPKANVLNLSPKSHLSQEYRCRRHHRRLSQQPRQRRRWSKSMTIACMTMQSQRGGPRPFPHAVCPPLATVRFPSSLTHKALEWFPHPVHSISVYYNAIPSHSAAYYYKRAHFIFSLRSTSYLPSVFYSSRHMTLSATQTLLFLKPSVTRPSCGSIHNHYIRVHLIALLTAPTTMCIVLLRCNMLL